MEELASKQNVNPLERVQRTREMHVSVVEARSDSCKECHDLDNSPDFLMEGGFDKYWPKVKHGRPALEKVQDLLNAIAKGKRPIEDLALIQDWLPDMKIQNPSRVELVELAIERIRSNPANAVSVISATLAKLDAE
jgi:hypothetical protein